MAPSPPCRVLLLTGKGGVGKTTAAAATAVRCAALGQRTLVLSTDPAHSLADALAVDLGDRPTSVAPRLHGQQLDARARLEANWGELRRYLSGLVAWAGVEGIEVEELTVLPGLDDVLALADLVEQVASGDWDTVVIDSAPTAETLRLLSLPDVLAWWMDRLFPIGRRLTGVVGPVVRQLTGLPIADDSVFGALERLHHRLAAAKALLTDRERTAIRLVVNPEQVVVAEARRTATYLALFGYPLDAVIVNRLLPASVSDPFFDHWRDSQGAQLRIIEEGFAPVPVLRVPLAASEPVGRKALAAFAKVLYGRADPREPMHDGDLLRVRKHDDGWHLELDLPFGRRGEVDLVRREGELVVSIGPYRRSLVLPDSLRDRAVRDASLRDGVLTVVFAR